MQQTKVYALVDCNNFYASCERAFNPSLNNKPIVVLSNNDGCIVARSNEARALNIPMGAPFFKYRAVLEKNNVHVFSSNYQLYGDMSQRVMSILRSFVPDFEMYSIDEAFLDLTHYPHHNLQEYSEHIRKTILKWTGIPVSIGIAHSKTLAKIANHVAKKHIDTGVFDMRNAALQKSVLAEIEVEEIWGIGKRWGQKFRMLGLSTALDIQKSDAKWIRKRFSVVGERIVLELQGSACLGLEETIPPKKNILSSRSFGRNISTLEDVSEALSDHVARACKKLRAQNSRAQGLHVFLCARKNRDGGPTFQAGTSIGFEVARSDTHYLIAQAKLLLKNIYRANIHYKKCGVMLLDLMPNQFEQQGLFEAVDYDEQEKLMTTVDAVQTRFGNKSLFYAAQGVSRYWAMRSDQRSPRYTTAWSELVEVK